MYSITEDTYKTSWQCNRLEDFYLLSFFDGELKNYALLFRHNSEVTAEVD